MILILYSQILTDFITKEANQRFRTPSEILYDRLSSLVRGIESKICWYGESLYSHGNNMFPILITNRAVISTKQNT